MAEPFVTSQPDVAVKLRITEESAELKPITVYELLRQKCEETPDNNALHIERAGENLYWTYSQYFSTVNIVANAFINLGLKPFHGVGIMGFNSPEWLISDMAAIAAGGLAVGIYPTNTTVLCEYVLNDSKSNLLLVEEEAYLDKVWPVVDDLADLAAIVVWAAKDAAFKDKYSGKGVKVLSWEDLMKLGEDVSDEELKERTNALEPAKCCTVIYTSGTTGNPKGAMLSHDNCVFVAWLACKLVELQKGSHFISYLPLSHVAAQMVDIYVPLFANGCVNFAKPDALKGSLKDTILSVRPHAILGVPRVWEKIADALKAKGEENPWVLRKIAGWAKGVGLRGNYAKLKGESTPWGWGFAKMLVFDKVREKLGFDRCGLMATGAAPIMHDTLEYFMSLNMPLLEIYGMSESSGPHTLNLPGQMRVGTVGKTLQGLQTKIIDLEGEAEGTGEICMWGRNVFMGYIHNETKTKEVVDDEGWLHSGDIGRLDEDGYLIISGRLKELIIGAGGENIAPVPIEELLKQLCPLVGNAILIGDKLKFVSVLVALKCQFDADTGAPTDELEDGAAQLLKKKLGYEVTSVKKALDLAEVRSIIEEAIEEVNKAAPNRASQIKKMAFLPRDFSIIGGELGPTLKIRRPIVTKMYEDVIKTIYEE